MKKDVMSSPIRWAGSKKKILNEMLTFFDNTSPIYIEPFLGSGVVLINMLNNIEEFEFKRFIVNDINSSIIDFYIILRDRVDYLNKELVILTNKYNNLKTLKEQEELYYKVRDEYNRIKKCEKKSIYFYFLMKTGFNGVYRENRQGKFNVPFGKKEKINYEPEYMMILSKLIQNVEFYNLEYKKFLDLLEEKNILNNTFIYFDPPYIPEDNSVIQKQELYTNKSFEHKKFVQYLHKLNKTKFLVSMSESVQADKIYGEYIKNNVSDIIRTINPKKTIKSKEIVYSNYKINK